MTSNGEKLRSRRNALINAARWGIAGAVTVAGAFVIRKRIRLSGEGVCINEGLCNGCRISSECGLPQAEKFRQAMKTQSKNG